MTDDSEQESKHGHKWEGDDIVRVEFVDVATMMVFLKLDANGGYYYQQSAGLYNGPHPSADIACLEYFRMMYAEKTGKIYMSSKVSYDIDEVLAGTVKPL